jgi:hypothetical protein
MSRTYTKKPFSYYRRLNIQPEEVDKELVDIGYRTRNRHRYKLSSWDDIPFSNYCIWNFR